MEEKELVRQAVAGNREAFARLAEQAFPRVYRQARRMLRNDHEAENAAQEAMLKAYESIGVFHGRSRFLTWVTSIVTNHCLNLIGRRKKGDEKLQERAYWTQNSSPRPDAALIHEEDKEALYDALAELKPNEAQAFLLVTSAELSYEDGADLLGVSKGTFAWMVFEARKKLRQILEKQASADGKERK